MTIKGAIQAATMLLDIYASPVAKPPMHRICAAVVMPNDNPAVNRRYCDIDINWMVNTKDQTRVCNACLPTNRGR